MNPSERAGHYREIASKLRAVASTSTEASVKAELSWLAHSYDRLAEKVETSESLLFLDTMTAADLPDAKPGN